MVIDLPDIGQAGWGTDLNAAIRKSTSRVYNLEGYAVGDLTDGAVFGNAIDAAFTAMGTDGAPSILEIPPHPTDDGLWTDAVGNHTLPKNATIRGPGSESCVIHHTANNTWMTASGVEADLLSVRWAIQGVTIQGNDGNSQRALVIGNTYRNRCTDVIFQTYGLTWAVELANSVQWTEGMLFDQCSWRGNGKHVILAQSGTGTNSWAELRFLSCSMIMDVEAGIGIDVQFGGTDLYGGIWDIKFNTEADDVKLIQFAANTRMHDVHLTMMAELLGVVTGAVGWSLGSGASVEATGFANFVNHTNSGGSLSIGGGSVDTWVLGANSVGIKYATGTVSADGDVTLLRGLNSFHGYFSIVYIHTNRAHRQTWWVGFEQFSDTPIFRLIGEYVLGGQRVFGAPFIALLASDSSNPHLRVPVSNRNGGGAIRFTLYAEGQVFNEALLLPAANAGTLNEPYRGVGWDFNGLAANSGAAITNGATITTQFVGAARVNPAGAVTGIILEAGIGYGQTVTVVNESANLVTFATDATSNVSGGTGVTVAAGRHRQFVWAGSRWYPD